MAQPLTRSATSALTRHLVSSLACLMVQFIEVIWHCFHYLDNSVFEIIVFELLVSCFMLVRRKLRRRYTMFTVRDTFGFDCEIDEETSNKLEDEKEQEMQIGNPTDVKHVAHIGMDGPDASKPSWMNGFNSAQELSSQDGDLGNQESSPSTEKQKKQRRKVSIQNGHGTAIESPKGSENGEKQRRPRSIRNTDGESPSQDLPDIPKKSRRKKSKGSTGGSEGEYSSSRSKPGSLPDVAELES
ncbi:hypothetical protein V6N12_054893 [Hibiscus sabdariffa]|uniref:CRIB domain-containing protein n=1 Tax=Hibiscus sabdariffa TaxID=183260 RepID=A0ABR2D1T4_9ROSI